MKVTLTSIAAGPQGVARPGTVLDVPQEQAERMITERYARPYDKERDAKARYGFESAPESK